MTSPVGTIGGGTLATVDGGGSVRPTAASWFLDWWIGADDRWHVPATETAVRQRLVGGAPVIETAMRIPGGDAIHRVYGAVGSGAVGDAVVVEITNDSAVPFAAALVVRSVAGALRRPLDGPAMAFGRPPSREATAPDMEMFLLPVAHRTGVRVVLADSPAADPSSVPDAGRVAAGWRTHLDRGLRVRVPDERLMEAVAADRAALVMAARDAVLDRLPMTEATALVPVLDRQGFAPEAQEVAHAVRRNLRLTARLRRAVRPRPQRSVGSTSRNPGEGADRTAERVRSGLVREVGSRALALFSDIPARWMGQGIEVHDAPTQVGRLSCAVRWHGERPALLWELDSRPGIGPVTLTTPGLDPAWSTSEPRGEALLEAPKVGAPT